MTATTWARARIIDMNRSLALTYLREIRRNRDDFAYLTSSYGKQKTQAEKDVYTYLWHQLQIEHKKLQDEVEAEVHDILLKRQETALKPGIDPQTFEVRRE